MVTKETEKCLNWAMNKTFTYCLHCKYLHSVHITFHQHLHTLHHSTHIITPYKVKHGIAQLTGRTLAFLA